MSDDMVPGGEVWKTAAEWAELKLAGLLVSARSIKRKAKEQDWPGRKEVRGAHRPVIVYPLSALPEGAQEDYRTRQALAALKEAKALVPESRGKALMPVSGAGSLTEYQVKIAEARMVVLMEIDRMQSGLGSRNKAVVAMVQAAKDGALSEDLKRALDVANVKKGKRRAIGRTALFDWLKARDTNGFSALAPNQDGPNTEVPLWLAAFLKNYRKSQKPSAREILQKLEDDPSLLPAGVAMPSYRTVLRVLKDRNIITPQEVQKGRMGPRALVAMKGYKKRTTEGMEPTAVYTADGKTFDAEVENPLSGRPFRPEITSVLDVATRKCVGWSAALSENASGVTEALRVAVENGGIPAIWYTDNGSGFDNKTFDDPLTGILARMGTENMDSLPDRSHSRGVIERFQAIWNDAARGLPSYYGHDMDPDALKMVFRKSRKDIKEFGRSRLIPPWDLFLKGCELVVERYNNTPHRGLPTYRHPETGSKTHMTPNEVWAAWEAKGWQPVRPEEGQLDDLVRPSVMRTASRGLIKLFGNEYYAADLERYHGEEVIVAYDPKDAAKIWVREFVKGREAYSAGKLICVAEWNAHATRYVPVAVEEQAKEKRAASALKRLESHADDVRAELRGSGKVIDVEPVFLTEEEKALAAAMKEKIESRPEALQVVLQNGRPAFADDKSCALWLAANPEEITSEDRSWLRDVLKNRAFRMLLQAASVDVGTLEALARAKVA